MNAESIAQTLGGARKTNTGWVALCPAHDDHHPSLSIYEKGGKILVNCHAGCPQQAVIAKLKALGLWPNSGNGTGYHANGRGTSNGKTTRYVIRDLEGREIAVHGRHDFTDGREKRMWWEREGTRELKGLPVSDLPLYATERLPLLKPGDRVVVCEGEKAASALHARNIAAVGTVTGSATIPNDHVLRVLVQHRVVLWADNAIDGLRHMQQIANRLSAISCVDVRILVYTAGPPKGDAADFAGTDEELAAFVEGAPQQGDTQTQADTTVPKIDNGRESQATVLVKLARERTQLFHDGDDCFATIPIGEHLETHALASRGFRRWLFRLFFEAHQAAPNGEAVLTAINTLGGFARFDGAEQRVFCRVADHEHRVYIDLTDARWRVIEIDTTGWRVITAAECPVKFRHAHGMKALPEPTRGGSVDALRKFTNLTDDEFKLMVAWLVAAMRGRGPYPILDLQGEQGSAKSTTARLLRRLSDPNIANLRSEPREPRDLMITATNGWVIALDNISSLKPWLSDCLCRLATGGGFATRTLYENAEETIFEAQRPILLNGIEEFVLRGDLLDRTIIVSPPPIPANKRRRDADIDAAFEAAAPGIFGALLDAVSCALRNLDNVKFKTLPRMADFAIWTEAAAPAFGWKPGEFSEAYETNQRAASDLPLETPVAEAILKLTLPWAGTATKLLGELALLVDDPARQSKSWPSSGQSLRNVLARLAPTLRRAGVNTTLSRCDKRDKGRNRDRTISIEVYPEEIGMEVSAVSAAKKVNQQAVETADSVRTPCREENQVSAKCPQNGSEKPQQNHSVLGGADTSDTSMPISSESDIPAGDDEEGEL